MALAHNPRIATAGLVFNFDAKNPKCYPGSGVNCSDSIIQNAGLIENGPVFDSFGHFSFSTNDYIRFPNDTTLDNQSFSVEVLVRTNALSQKGFWFEKGTVNSQYSLFQENANIIWRGNTGGLVNMVSLPTASFLNTTDWFHIVGTCTSGSQVVYINGISRGTGTTAGTFSTNSGGMSIGAYGGYSGGHSYYYDGDIALVRVYSKVLQQSEVRQNFEAVRSRYGI